MAHVVLADPNSRELGEARRLLEEEGHAVRVARDGAELLRLLRERRPDVVVMDLLLPVRDGIEVLAELPGLYPDGLPPVIAVVAVGPDGTVGRSWIGPPDGYLVEPYTAWQVVLAVEQALYRGLSTAANVEALLRLRMLAHGIRLYIREHGGRLPPLGTVGALGRALDASYSAAGAWLVDPVTGRPFRTNRRLSGRKTRGLAGPGLRPLLWQDAASTEGTRAVAVLRLSPEPAAFATLVYEPEWQRLAQADGYADEDQMPRDGA